MAKASLNADYVRTEISRWQARSMAMSTRGIVAAENPLAAQAGAVVLARGGHAVDAAIAANAVMGLVAPMMSGVGGDLFAIVHDVSTGTVHGLNASGWSPAGATIEFLTSRGLTTMPQTGTNSNRRSSRRSYAGPSRPQPEQNGLPFFLGRTWTTKAGPAPRSSRRASP